MKIHFCTSENPMAKSAFKSLVGRYGQTDCLEDSDVVVSLGGDGTTLGILKECLGSQKPVFGLNYGTLGFLQNTPSSDWDLVERIDKAEHFELGALKADVDFVDGSITTLFAINEIFVFNRRRTQTIHLQLSVNNIIYCPKLESDGVIIATAVGSSGYSQSAGGSVVTLKRDVMIVTPNNQCHHGSKIPSHTFDSCIIDVDVLNPEFRKAGVTADVYEIENPVRHVRIEMDPKKRFTLLFDAGHDLHQRVLRTQYPSLNAG